MPAENELYEVLLFTVHIKSEVGSVGGHKGRASIIHVTDMTHDYSIQQIKNNSKKHSVRVLQYHNQLEYIVEHMHPMCI